MNHVNRLHPNIYPKENGAPYLIKSSFPWSRTFSNGDLLTEGDGDGIAWAVFVDVDLVLQVPCHVATQHPFHPNDSAASQIRSPQSCRQTASKYINKLKLPSTHNLIFYWYGDEMR